MHLVARDPTVIHGNLVILDPNALHVIQTLCGFFRATLRVLKLSVEWALISMTLAKDIIRRSW